MQALRFPSRDEPKEPTHNCVLISSSRTTRLNSFTELPHWSFCVRALRFPSFCSHTHTPIKGRKKGTAQGQGTLSHSNGSNTPELSGKGWKRWFHSRRYALWKSIQHVSSQILKGVLYFLTSAAWLYYNAWRVCVRRIKHSLTSTPTSSLRKKTVRIKETIVRWRHRMSVGRGTKGPSFPLCFVKARGAK